MQLDTTSLAIGVGIGIAVVTAVAVVFVILPGSGIIESETLAADAFSSSNQSHFFISGPVKELSDDLMILDQTVGRPELNDNPAVKLRLDRGAAFVSCIGTEDPMDNCEKSITKRLGKVPVWVCAHTRLYNGEFYAGKIWADSGCGPFPIEDLSAQ